MTDNKTDDTKRLARDPLTMSVLLLGNELVVRAGGYSTAACRISDEDAQALHLLVHRLLPAREFAALMAWADRDEVA